VSEAAGVLESRAEEEALPLPPQEETARLLDVMMDPPNRFFRYPAARALYKVAGWLPFTPNQVTFFHGAIGQAGAAIVAFAPPAWWPLTFVLFEIRAILDCYDGVLAREKKIFSTYGRTLDELSDFFAFFSLNLAITYRSDRPLRAFLIGLVIAVTSILASWGHDFLKRKFTSALKEGKDSVVIELRPRVVALKKNPTMMARWAHFFDASQVKILSRHSMKETLALADDPDGVDRTTDTDRILAAAKTPRLRRAFRAMSLMAGDNVVAVGAAAVAFGHLHEAQLAIVTYATVTVTVGLVLSLRILRRGAK
jgi:phosphatidylglycerophosphate synthase